MKILYIYIYMYTYIQVKFDPLLKKLSPGCLSSPSLFHVRQKMDIAPRGETAKETLSWK